METAQALFGKAAGVVYSAVFLIYVLSIFFGPEDKRTKPSKSSWWILTLVWTVLLWSSIDLAEGDSFIEKWNSIAGNWVTLANILGSFTIAILSIWRGHKEPWKVFDWLCLIFACIALGISIGNGDNVILSLIFCILADFFGFLPTIKNAWKFPKNENFLAWKFETLASILSLLAINNWAFDSSGIVDWLTPAYLTIASGVVLGILFYKNRTLKI